MQRRIDLYLVVRLWVELTRKLNDLDPPAALRGRFGSHTPDMLIRAAIFIATVENRGMTAAKLADFIGLPRATVVRRLASLERRGIIERSGEAWRTAQAKLQRVDRQDTFHLADLVHSHAKALQHNRSSTGASKMDSRAIPRRPRMREV